MRFLIVILLLAFAAPCIAQDDLPLPDIKRSKEDQAVERYILNARLKVLEESSKQRDLTGRTSTEPQEMKSILETPVTTEGDPEKHQIELLKRSVSALEKRVELLEQALKLSPKPAPVLPAISSSPAMIGMYRYPPVVSVYPVIRVEDPAARQQREQSPFLYYSRRRY